MSATFVAQLRTGRPPIFVASGPNAITIRVEAADLWETVRVAALPSTLVSEVKQRVVKELFPETDHHDDFVLKLHGWEMLDARASLSDAGVVDGSILLVAYRRRRPVR
ncbi:MAG: ubiquitin-like domain-containing protein [Gemmatimonadota bacterium]